MAALHMSTAGLLVLTASRLSRNYRLPIAAAGGEQQGIPFRDSAAFLACPILHRLFLHSYVGARCRR
jgi:uncharacterized protein (DUF1684 family)